MGKASLLWVFMVSTSLSVLCLGITVRNNQSTDVAANRFDEATANSIAASAAEIGLRNVISSATTYSKDTSFSFGSMNGGNATIAVKVFTADSVRLTCTGSYGRLWDDLRSVYRAASDTIDVTVARAPGGPPPLITAALSVSYGSKADIKSSNTTIIDGHNHDLSGNLSTAYPDVAGMSVAQLSDYSLSYSGTLKISGKGPVEPDIEQVSSQPDWYQLAMSLIPRADIVITGKMSQTRSLGSLDAPKITYVKGTVSFSQVSGVGILIIDGSISNMNNFTWTGVVIFVGDSAGKNQAKFTKVSQVVGAVIMTGQQVKYEQTGKTNLKYSHEAIKLAFRFSGNYRVAAWWE